MQMTGLDGWAHATPFDAGDGDLEWMAKNDRFVIATANVGEKLSGARVKEDKEQKLVPQPPGCGYMGQGSRQRFL